MLERLIHRRQAPARPTGCACECCTFTAYQTGTAELAAQLCTCAPGEDCAAASATPNRDGQGPIGQR